MEIKTIFIEVIKKNKKYFVAKIKNVYDVKIVIDENSEALKVGDKALIQVEYVSGSIKSGVVYRLTEPLSYFKYYPPVTLNTRYNKLLVEECHKLGGVWNGQVWMFPWFLGDEVTPLEMIFNSDPVTVEAIAPTDLFFYKSSADFLGYPLIANNIRGNRPKVLKSVHLLEGGIKKVGYTNWESVVEKGTKIRLKIPEMLLDYYSTPWKFEVIQERG